MPQEPGKKTTALHNRFDMLNTDGDTSSDEENRDPFESHVEDSDECDDDTVDDIRVLHGVRLDCNDAETNS